jgi:hypothetical protein
VTRDQLLQLQSVARLYQERYDKAFESWGLKAPAPAICDSAEAVNDYRREQAVRAKKLLPLSETRVAPNEPTFGALRRAQYRSMDNTVLDVMEPSLIRAVMAAGKRNDSIPADSPPREIHEIGPNGERTIRFLGQRSFIHDMKPPIRKVCYFRTPSGPVRTDGMPVQL